MQVNGAYVIIWRVRMNKMQYRKILNNDIIGFMGNNIMLGSQNFLSFQEAKGVINSKADKLGPKRLVEAIKVLEEMEQETPEPKVD